MNDSKLPFTLTPLEASFGAQITGLDLANMNDACFQALYQQWLTYALLVFPDQHLSKSEQVAFAQRFGPLEFDLAAISNVRKDGSLRPADGDDDVVKILKGNMGWHCDSTYMPVQAKGAVFTAHQVPSQGGQTAWADMRAAYLALSVSQQQQLQNLSAYHSLYYSQSQLGHHPDAQRASTVAAQADTEQRSGNGNDYSGYGFHGQPPPLRPLVKIHPETHQPSLLIGRHAYGVVGMSEQESTQLLDQLLEFACQAPRVYRHDWQVGDAVVWDNRCLLHKAFAWDMRQPRVMYHSRIAGDGVTEYAPSD